MVVTRSMIKKDEILEALTGSAKVSAATNSHRNRQHTAHVHDTVTESGNNGNAVTSKPSASALLHIFSTVDLGQHKSANMSTEELGQHLSSFMAPAEVHSLYTTCKQLHENCNRRVYASMQAGVDRLAGVTFGIPHGGLQALTLKGNGLLSGSLCVAAWTGENSADFCRRVRDMTLYFDADMGETELNYLDMYLTRWGFNVAIDHRHEVDPAEGVTMGSLRWARSDRPRAQVTQIPTHVKLGEARLRRLNPEVLPNYYVPCGPYDPAMAEHQHLRMGDHVQDDNNLRYLQPYCNPYQDIRYGTPSVVDIQMYTNGYVNIRVIVTDIFKRQKQSEHQYFERLVPWSVLDGIDITVAQLGMSGGHIRAASPTTTIDLRNRVLRLGNQQERKLIEQCKDNWDKAVLTAEYIEQHVLKYHYAGFTMPANIAQPPLRVLHDIFKHRPYWT